MYHRDQGNLGNLGKVPNSPKFSWHAPGWILKAVVRTTHGRLLSLIGTTPDIQAVEMHKRVCFGRLISLGSVY